MCLKVHLCKHVKWQINEYLKINRNTFDSFPQIIDTMRFYLHTEKTIKTMFCVHFDSETINIYLETLPRKNLRDL